MSVSLMLAVQKVELVDLLRPAQVEPFRTTPCPSTEAGVDGLLATSLHASLLRIDLLQSSAHTAAPHGVPSLTFAQARAKELRTEYLHAKDGTSGQGSPHDKLRAFFQLPESTQAKVLERIFVIQYGVRKV